jgi:hypothetical protein
MRRFLKNTRGAVTVFVTMLLIPAILVSGTAVDLARIHTARSIVQDANQLAANSMLTQYNKLLYDLYALFGVAENDPILAELLDEYIKVSIFGEVGQDRAMGTLQVFYGSNISMDEPLFAEDKNLRNEYVLRRQIEEYMKFRGPVIIVKEVLELLGSSTFKEDAGVINDKLEIESAISDIYERYRVLYDAIITADKCNQVSGGIVGGTVGTVSSSLELIRQELVNLAACYAAWENVGSADDDNDDYIDYIALKNDYAAQYSAILENIVIRTLGGNVGSGWNNGDWDKVTQSPSQGLNKTIENAKGHADNFKPRFDIVVAISREIDGMKDELSRKIDELESRLENGECHEELKSALTEKSGIPPKSLIDTYRDILKWDNLEEMASVFKAGGYDYIDKEMKPLLDTVVYGIFGSTNATHLTRIQLADARTTPALALSDTVPFSRSSVAILAGYTRNQITYKVPDGFLRYGDHPGDNEAFFKELTAMMEQPSIPPVKLYDGQSEADGDNTKDKQQNMIDDLLKLVNSAYAGLKNEPLGARYINDSSTSGTEKLNMLEIVKIIPEALSSPVASVISDPLGSAAEAGEYLLLLLYSTSMFSNYATTRPENTGKTRDDLEDMEFTKSITGVPISPEVNYFYQSELEYLYSGHENAAKNLNAISRLIFTIRLILNYTTVFSVKEVTVVVNAIKAAFSWSPPLAIILSELARAAFVAAESTIDVARLRAGYKVPLRKNITDGQWVCSPRGIVKALADVVSDTVGGDKSDEKGLTYSNYLVFLLISKSVVYIGSEADAATELTKRMGNLIEWNIINYSNNVFSDEDKMAEALLATDRFKLVDMKTDFSLTTIVDMRMLFLSMIFAQNFSDARGIGMPTTMPVVVTDYRGY